MTDDRKVDVEFGAKISGILAGAKEAAAAVKESTEQMKMHIEALNGVVNSLKQPFVLLSAFLAGGEIFKETIEKTAELGKHFEVLSQKTGMAVEDLSRLEYAANLTDVSAEQLGVGLTRLARGMEQAEKGAGPVADAFQRMGLTATDADGRLKPMNTMLLDIADRFKAMENGAGKTALAMDIFGRSGASLIPMLNAGREGIANLEAEADRLGITMSESGVEAANRYVDAMKTFHATVDALARMIAISIMPALADVARGLIELIAPTDNATHRTNIFAAAIRELSIGLTGGYVALYSFGKLFEAVWLTMTTHPANAGLVWAKVAAQITDVEEKAANAILKMRGFGGHSSATEGGGEAAPSVPGLSTLEQLQLQWLKIEEANKDHLGSLTSMELHFWQDNLSQVAKGSKEYLEIRRRIVALEKTEAKESYDAKLAAMQAQEVLDQDDKRRVLADRKDELALIRQHYDEQSKEVQDGIKRVNEAMVAVQKEGSKQWEEAFDAFPNAFNKAAAGIGTTVNSLRDLFRSFFLDLGQMGIEAGAASLRHHIATELAKKDVTLASAAERVAAESWAAIRTVALSAWSALVQIANYAMVAIAATWASISAIPVVGPFIAPAMALGAGALLLSLGGRIASAAGGYDIPAGINPMTQLHAQEMVLPAELANKIRGMDSGGSGGGDTYHIHAMDSKSFEDFAHRNYQAFAGATKKAVKYGALTSADMRG